MGKQALAVRCRVGFVWVLSGCCAVVVPGAAGWRLRAVRGT